MRGTVPVKLIAIIALVAAMFIAALTAILQPDNGKKGVEKMSPEDSQWLKQRLARAPEPAPRPGQPQVLLIWRSKEASDVDKVREVAQLVDQPNRPDGVYGMDVADSDALASKVNLNGLMVSQPVQGAWLIVLNSSGSRIGFTPVITEDNIRTAFDVAKGKAASFPGGEDPYLGKAAPKFTAQTLDGSSTVSLSSLRGKNVVLTFYCGCDRCKAMAKVLADLQKSPYLKAVQFYAVTHMLPEANAAFMKSTGQRYIALKEKQLSPQISDLYSSKKCPRVWYINPRGEVGYYSLEDEDPQQVSSGLMDAMRKSMEG